mgnify:CR=1 FL=1
MLSTSSSDGGPAATARRYRACNLSATVAKSWFTSGVVLRLGNRQGDSHFCRDSPGLSSSSCNVQAVAPPQPPQPPAASDQLGVCGCFTNLPCTHTCAMCRSLPQLTNFSTCRAERKKGGKKDACIRPWAWVEEGGGHSMGLQAESPPLDSARAEDGRRGRNKVRARQLSSPTCHSQPGWACSPAATSPACPSHHHPSSTYADQRDPYSLFFSTSTSGTPDQSASPGQTRGRQHRSRRPQAARQTPCPPPASRRCPAVGGSRAQAGRLMGGHGA